MTALTVVAVLKHWSYIAITVLDYVRRFGIGSDIYCSFVAISDQSCLSGVEYSHWQLGTHPLFANDSDFYRFEKFLRNKSFRMN